MGPVNVPCCKVHLSSHFIDLCSVSNFSTYADKPSAIIGLTGGIGSGKSIVGRVFHAMGVPVWDADAAGRSLYENDKALQLWVVEYFGKQCGHWKHGTLRGINRKVLAKHVFNDATALQALNDQVHPRVRSNFQNWHQKTMKLHRPNYVIRESALLFESNAFDDCNHIIAVEANEAVQIERVSQRSGLTAEEVRARMAFQLSDTERGKRADFILKNDTKSNLLAAIERVHQDVLQRLA